MSSDLPDLSFSEVSVPPLHTHHDLHRISHNNNVKTSMSINRAIDRAYQQGQAPSPPPVPPTRSKTSSPPSVIHPALRSPASEPALSASSPPSRYPPRQQPSTSPQNTSHNRTRSSPHVHPAFNPPPPIVISSSPPVALHTRSASTPHISSQSPSYVTPTPAPSPTPRYPSHYAVHDFAQPRLSPPIPITSSLASPRSPGTVGSTSLDDQRSPLSPPPEITFAIASTLEKGGRPRIVVSRSTSGIPPPVPAKDKYTSPRSPAPTPRTAGAATDPARAVRPRVLGPSNPALEETKAAFDYILHILRTTFLQPFKDIHRKTSHPLQFWKARKSTTSEKAPRQKDVHGPWQAWDRYDLLIFAIAILNLLMLVALIIYWSVLAARRIRAAGGGAGLAMGDALVGVYWENSTEVATTAGLVAGSAVASKSAESGITTVVATLSSMGGDGMASATVSVSLEMRSSNVNAMTTSVVWSASTKSLASAAASSSVDCSSAEGKGVAGWKVASGAC